MKCLKLFVILAVLSLFFSCGSDDNCVKVEYIRQYYLVNNQSYPYNVYSEVDCSYIAPYEPELIQPVILPGTTYETINFQYTPSNSGSNSVLNFELKIQNNEDYEVEGFALVYFMVDGIERSIIIEASSTVNACPMLTANGFCVIQFYGENVFNASSVEITGLTYYVISE